MTCQACGTTAPWLPAHSGVPLCSNCIDTSKAKPLVREAEKAIRLRRQQRELARARAGIQAQATGMVRCTDCTRFPGRGRWCPEGKLHANGSWRKCAHWTDQAQELLGSTQKLPASEDAIPNPTVILGQLRSHPAVVSVEATPTGIMLRICKSATERQRGEVAAIMAGRVDR